MNYIIYQIKINDKPDFIYVGSTKSFTMRKWNHKKNCNNNNAKNYKIYSIINENGGWEKCEMIPIENLICENNIDARIREEYWRKELNANLNSNRCYTTEEEKIQQKSDCYFKKIDYYKENMKQYYEENKIDILEKSKKYYEENAEKIKERIKIYNHKNKDEIAKKSKERHLKNIEKIKEKNKLTAVCSCGKTYTLCNKSRHEKTKFHLDNFKN